MVFDQLMHVGIIALIKYACFIQDFWFGEVEKQPYASVKHFLKQRNSGSSGGEGILDHVLSLS